MANELCPECFEGAHSQCIGQGCYCDCQLPNEDDDDTVRCWACGGSGITIEGFDCDVCDGDGYLPI
jgi:hypothetical protein